LRKLSGLRGRALRLRNVSHGGSSPDREYKR
jgi:hypothetical protein